MTLAFTSSTAPNGKTANRTFAQGAANGGNEPILPDAAVAANGR
jgi:hypothetical protein